MPFEIRVSDRAWRDIDDVLAWTRSNFGERQREEYWALILEALSDIARDPETARRRPELHEKARTFHIARSGRRARHFLLLRILDGNVVEIGRLLYDGMDLASHLPSEYGQ
ncbi:MAG: type II toxin-antitoxin system RelE/ParE family toxin [Phycisphaeraceae bacterium]|nr:type II toxin-antitoxin system RelE/ParE family toxin [Phycisphaeraceae bacterium]